MTRRPGGVQSLNDHLAHQLGIERLDRHAGELLQQAGGG